jgi:hypothetical protein
VRTVGDPSAYQRLAADADYCRATVDPQTGHARTCTGAVAECMVDGRSSIALPLGRSTVTVTGIGDSGFTKAGRSYVEAADLTGPSITCTAPGVACTGPLTPVAVQGECRDNCDASCNVECPSSSYRPGRNPSRATRRTRAETRGRATPSWRCRQRRPRRGVSRSPAPRMRRSRRLRVCQHGPADGHRPVRSLAAPVLQSRGWIFPSGSARHHLPRHRLERQPGDLPYHDHGPRQHSAGAGLPGAGSPRVRARSESGRHLRGHVLRPV